MQECCGMMGMIFGHKFRPRYSTNETDSALGKKITSFRGDVKDELILVEQKYHGDICVRCGLIKNHC